MALKPHFTKANASEYARKGNAIRWARYREPEPTPAISLPEPLRVADNSFQARRLERVRSQLELVDSAIEAEAGLAKPDGQRLNWLAQAQDRLSEQERKLAGRPLPGSRRPRDNDRTPANPGAYRVYDDSPPVPAKPVVPEVAKVEPETPRPQFPDGGCP